MALASRAGGEVVRHGACRGRRRRPGTRAPPRSSTTGRRISSRAFAPGRTPRLRRAPGHVRTRDATADAVDLLAPGGAWWRWSGWKLRPAGSLVSRLYTKDARASVGFAINNADRRPRRGGGGRFIRVLRDTPWRPRIADRLPLSMTAEAHRRLEAGVVRGGWSSQPL
ncbi:hypothetical protein LV779_26460 [Streptomyces thinghirensis]|nr:hypothetical protein [Streptomyces thinghirensis]